MLSRESRRTAGIILVVFPTVIYGGASLLELIISKRLGYLDNPVRQDLFRAGHAHAGVLLILALVVLRYMDEARLPDRWKKFARSAVPAAAILLPAGFFLCILSPASTSPTPAIYLCFAGAALLATGLLTVGIGLLRRE